MTQTRQLSQRIVKDAVRIELPEGNSARPDLATCPGGRNNTVGRLTSFNTTPGSSIWGPQPSSHRQTEMREIQQTIQEFSQYCGEFPVITAVLDWDPSALLNAPRMGLSEQIKDSFTCSDMSEEPPAFVTVCQRWDNLIRQRRAERAAQNKGVGLGFASPRPPPSPKAPEMAPAGTVAGYTEPAPVHLSIRRRRISAEERAKRFADGRCLYSGGFNHKAVECVARKKAHTFKAAGA
jgi:hypothetical protein